MEGFSVRGFEERADDNLDKRLGEESARRLYSPETTCETGYERYVEADCGGLPDEVELLLVIVGAWFRKRALGPPV